MLTNAATARNVREAKEAIGPRDVLIVPDLGDKVLAGDFESDEVVLEEFDERRLIVSARHILPKP